MDINLTLLGEMITFSILVWVMMKYIWPPLMYAIQERQQKITDGIIAAEKSKKDLELADISIHNQLKQADINAAQILSEANQLAIYNIEKGKQKALEEKEKIMMKVKIETEQLMSKANVILQDKTLNLAFIAVEKILKRTINNDIQKELINDLINNIQ